MKNSRITLCLMTMALSALQAETVGTLTFVDGWVDVKTGKGAPVEAFIGDEISTGDSVITGSDGTATLEREDALTITVAPDTVFVLQELETDKGKETAMAAAVGSVRFKFGRLLGREPQIRTPSMVAGVRGTEFTVWTAPEGSTLIAVTSGEVAVSAEGATVSLTADEGVAVEPGKTPGDKFSLLGRPLNHKEWADQKMAEFLENPMEVLEGLETRLKGYYREVLELADTREQQLKNLDVKRAELKEIQRDEGKEKGQEFYTTQVMPLESNIGKAYLNLRYWSLSAYNLKRHALTKTYLVMKTKYLADPEVDVFKDYLDEYQRIIGEFWDTLGPYLTENDV
ncbi:MAG: FecR domain-containing protein [Spirochaetales bacterium]|nr:FecR domain-containing protein [Spirochaetales bacterium]